MASTARCAGVEQVRWEERIEWGDSSDDDEAAAMEVEQTFAPNLGANRSLASGRWLDVVNWGEGSDDGAPALRRPPVPPSVLDAPARGGDGARRPRTRAFAEPAVSRKRKREKNAAKSGLPRAAHALPAQLHKFIAADPSAAAQLHFHRPRLGPRVADSEWVLRGASPSADPASDPASSAASRRAGLRRRGSGGLSLHAVTRETELRASDGDLLLLEFSEERPPLVANAGMASTLCRIRRKEKNSNESNDEREHAHTRGHAVDLGPEDASPLLGDVGPEDVSALCGDLFRAPAFPHTTGDFLLVLKPRPRRRRDEASPPLEWVVRALDRRFGFAVAGQIERTCARLGCDEAGIGALMNYAWTWTPRA